MSFSQLLSQLYDEYGTSLFYYARSLLRSSVDAEEVLQNLFLGLVEQQEKLNQIDHLKGYLFAGVRKEAMRIIRNQNRYEEELENLNRLVPLRLKEGSSCEKEEASLLEKAVNELPEEQQEVMVLKHFSQLTFREIAEIVETSPDTVASRYRYGIQKIKLKLRKLEKSVEQLRE